MKHLVSGWNVTKVIVLLLMVCPYTATASTQSPVKDELEETIKLYAVVKNALTPESQSLALLRGEYKKYYASNKDGYEIHGKYNAAIVRSFREPVTRTLEGCKLQPTPLELLLPEINNTLNTNEIPSFAQSMVVLKGHLQKSEVDPETGINVARFTSFAWALAQLLDTHSYFGKSPDAQGQKEERHSRAGYFCYTMAQNLTEHGSCFGGYAGRIFHFTVQMLLEVHYPETADKS